MEGDIAVFELVEGSIIVLVYCDEVLLKSLKFVLILWCVLQTIVQFGFKLGQICPSSLNVFLGFKKEDLLFFVVRFDLFSQCIFSILQHLYQNLEFFMQFRQCTLFLTLKTNKSDNWDVYLPWAILQSLWVPHKIYQSRLYLHLFSSSIFMRAFRIPTPILSHPCQIYCVPCGPLQCTCYRYWPDHFHTNT